MDELSLLRSELYTGRRALSALQQELTQVPFRPVPMCSPCSLSLSQIFKRHVRRLTSKEMRHLTGYKLLRAAISLVCFATFPC